MGPLRAVVLWAAENRWLRTHLPRYRFVRASVRRFMPGETLDEALAAAAELRTHGIAAAFTHLGENVATEDEARAVLDHYLGAVDAIAERGLEAEVSVKPTHLGLDVGRAVAGRNLDTLARAAEARGQWLWLDMESTRYVDPTLDLYRELRANHQRTGICLQAYLRRTQDDIETLLPLEASVRLVKGAYKEPPTLLVGGRSLIDESYRSLAVRMLERAGDASRIVLGTHDVDLATRIERDAKVRGMARDAFEIEMLYGIRSKDQVHLAAEGYRLRTLIAYGSYWYPWYLRRIAEKPVENTLLALRNLLPG